MRNRNVETRQVSNGGGLSPAGTTVSVDKLRARLRASARNQTFVVWLLVLASIALSGLASPSFPSVRFVQGVLTLGLFLVIIAFGQGLAILTGGFDLSVPAIVALAAYSTGYLSSTGLPTLIAIAIALILAATVGALNGLLVAKTGFPPFIITLAVGSIVASLLLGFSQTTAPAQKSPDILTAIFAGHHAFLDIPLPIWILIALVALATWVQNGTTFGRYAYALGNSVRAAQIIRLPVTRSIIMTYLTAAVFYGIGGMMLLGYGSGADLNIGSAWLLPSIAAVVVGGSSIKGGSGSYLGTVGGALLLTVIDIDIRAVGLAEGYRQALYGILILLALLGARVAAAKRA